MAVYPSIQVRLDSSSAGAVEKFGNGYAIFTGVDSPLSRAVGIGLDKPVEAFELERVEEFFKGRGARVVIDVCPLADSSFIALLGERGYRVAEFHHIWYRALEKDERFAQQTSGPEVLEVGPTDAELWIRTVTRGFMDQDNLTDKDVEIATMSFMKSDTRCFLARIEGRPVGGGVLAINDGLAALFSGSTVKDFRRRGVQTALLRARMEAAALASCDLAVIKTSPGTASQRNVERAGFRLAYTRAAMMLESND
jgi:ribosomal protein S18 acetylase RimI-like enzyme